MPLYNPVQGNGGGVSSVNTRTGPVTLTSADVGLGNVNNTSDAAKPVSTAQQAALDLKAPLASAIRNYTTEATSAVDARILGKSASAGTLALYSAANDTAHAYTRNASLWCADLDWSGISASTSVGWRITMITPRHGLTAHHIGMPTGTVGYWVDANNATVSREVTSVVNVVGDMDLVTLDSDLPASIHPYAILPLSIPPGFQSGTGSLVGAPVITHNQNRHLCVATLGTLNSGPSFYANVLAMPTTGIYAPWNRAADAAGATTPAINGDSSSPYFLVIGGQPVLLGCLADTAGNGPDPGQNAAALQTAIGNGYSLTIAAMPSFPGGTGPKGDPGAPGTSSVTLPNVTSLGSNGTNNPSLSHVDVSGMTEGDLHTIVLRDSTNPNAYEMAYFATPSSANVTPPTPSVVWATYRLTNYPSGGAGSLPNSYNGAGYIQSSTQGKIWILVDAITSNGDRLDGSGAFSGVYGRIYDHDSTGRNFIATAAVYAPTVHSGKVQLNGSSDPGAPINTATLYSSAADSYRFHARYSDGDARLLTTADGNFNFLNSSPIQPFALWLKPGAQLLSDPASDFDISGLPVTLLDSVSLVRKIQSRTNFLVATGQASAPIIVNCYGCALTNVDDLMNGIADAISSANVFNSAYTGPLTLDFSGGTNAPFSGVSGHSATLQAQLPRPLPSNAGTVLSTSSSYSSYATTMIYDGGLALAGSTYSNQSGTDTYTLGVADSPTMGALVAKYVELNNNYNFWNYYNGAFAPDGSFDGGDSYEGDYPLVSTGPAVEATNPGVPTSSSNAVATIQGYHNSSVTTN